MKEIFEEIQKEREYQINKWGDSFDDLNTANDWVTYITQYASQSAPLVFDKDNFETKMIKVATLAVAAIQSSRKNNGPAKRHYDR